MRSARRYLALRVARVVSAFTLMFLGVECRLGLAQTSSPPHRRAKLTQPSITKELPTAHVGQLYSASLENIPGLNYKESHVTCTSTPSDFPAGLKFDGDSLTIHGEPVAALPTHFAVEVVCEGAMKHPVRMSLLLPIHNQEEVVNMSGTATAPTARAAGRPAPASAATPADAADADGKESSGPMLTQDQLDSLQIVVDPSLVEGATSISGHVEGIPPGVSDLAVQLLLTPKGQSPTVAALKSPDGGTMHAAPVDAKGTFSFSPVTPLGGGQTVTVRLVTPPGLMRHEGAAEVGRELSDVIPAPTLELMTVLRAGAKTIQGTALPVAANASTPPPVSQVPRVAVMLRDYGAGEGQWYAGTLTTSAGGTASEQVIGNDGNFTVTLATPLADGQSVRFGFTAPPGHRFRDRPTHDEAINSAEQEVVTALAITSPVITTALNAGVTAISGTATPSMASGATVNVGVVEDYGGWVGSTRVGCVFADRLGEAARRNAAFALLPLTTASGTTATFVPTATTGEFKLTLADALIDGEKLHLVQIFPTGTVLTEQQRDACDVGLQEVNSRLDWGRVHADFTVGVLISNDSGNSTVPATTGTTTTGTAGTTTTTGSGDFSQAHQFYALSVEKFWLLPGKYVPANSCECAAAKLASEKCKKACADRSGDDLCAYEASRPEPRDLQRQTLLASRERRCDEKHSHDLSFRPGLAGFFDARLTAIPISNISSNTSSTPTTNLLSTSQTAKVEVGTYLPFFAQKWMYANRPNALFLAPLAKIGFNTLTGAQVANSNDSNGTGQQQRLYNFWGFGGRIGHMELTRSRDRAPETFSYLDIIFGPYSNLQSFLCKLGTANRDFTNSQCSAYGASNGEVIYGVESRKRVYRLDLEGLLKIPKTPLYVGFNANIGQKTVGAERLDRGYAAPDDLRFFFGTKFDIAALLNKFNLGAN